MSSSSEHFNVESSKNLQVKILQDFFTKEQLEELEKDYYVSFNGGILFLGAKKIHISKRDDKND